MPETVQLDSPADNSTLPAPAVGDASPVPAPASNDTLPPASPPAPGLLSAQQPPLQSGGVPTLEEMITALAAGWLKADADRDGLNV